jgi:hypothetical protein
MHLNALLASLGISPKDAVLLRHQDGRAHRGRTPYALLRDSPAEFDIYQSDQSFYNRSALTRAPYWVSFVGTPDGATMFAGLYAVKYKGVLDEDRVQPHTGAVDAAGSCDIYDLQIDERLAHLRGKLFIEWGAGVRRWIQRADSKRGPKQIVELRREFKEEAFPGFLNFMAPLSKIEGLPSGWREHLQNSRGVYLLTCPKTKEQYVGKASGAEGFWQRWMTYVANGHGGNVALKSRELSDYRVSILEVAGSSASEDDILKMESRWKSKLQSVEMGLNRNK